MEFTIEEIKEAFYCFETKRIAGLNCDSLPPIGIAEAIFDSWSLLKSEFKEILDKKELWKTDIAEYLRLVNEAKIKILTTPELYNRPLKDFPHLHVQKSIERSIEYFWGTEKGWKYKIKESRKVKKFNMVSTLLANIDKNKVFIPFDQQKPEPEPKTPARHVTPAVEI